MKTPKEYAQNIKQGTVTDVMLADALFSANKRAKNYRDQERKNRNSRYAFTEKASEEKQKYYGYKNKLLSVLEPVAIHKERIPHTQKIFDWEEDYLRILDSGDYYRTGGYFDHDLRRYVEFLIADWENEYRYYLLYQVAGRTFHNPIEDYQAIAYDLPIETIERLETRGKAVSDIVSVPFIRSVLDLIELGGYKPAEA